VWFEQECIGIIMKKYQVMSKTLMNRPDSEFTAEKSGKRLEFTKIKQFKVARL
jgi:hypothetical protein